jgi:hypothetical protein
LKTVNKWLWRTTALWCWVHLLTFVFLRHDLLAVPERAVSLKIFHFLVSYGFSPSNPKLYPLLLKVFWLLLLTRGKAIVLMGFAIYVAFAPLALAWNLFFYFLRRAKGLPKPIDEAPVLTWEERQFAKSSSWLLICGIVLWFLMYGQTGSRGPLVLGLAMTGSLFLIQFYRTTLRVALAEIDEAGLISRIAHSPYGYLVKVFRQISGGTFRTDEQLFMAARYWMWFLGRLRRLNAYMRGKGAERRAALLVLLRYSFGLMSIAALAVLFWSFVIRLSSSSTITTKDALLASAARMVPGVAGPEAIKISNLVQTGASLTAWFVFVLYAGPMASMFPILLERYVRKISEANDKLRAGRRLIYTLADAVLRLENRMGENPTTSVQSSQPALVRSDSANSPN